jgi:ankyrin repeat protein
VLERGKSKQIAEIITRLAKAGADVNARGNLDETPIFAANYQPEAVKPLLEAGANLEARNRIGDTPLIRYGFMEPMVRELLANGADPTAVAKNGDTALKIARGFQCPTCAALIEAAQKQRAANSPTPQPADIR